MKKARSKKCWRSNMPEEAKPLSYIVVCRDDADEDGNPGPYVLATRTVFHAHRDAALYALSINAARQPITVVGDLGNLRFNDSERIKVLTGGAFQCTK
jgi:hypothetical protein